MVASGKRLGIHPHFRIYAITSNNCNSRISLLSKIFAVIDHLPGAGASKIDTEVVFSTAVPCSLEGDGRGREMVVLN
jgi:hypothetical protein